MNLQCRMRYMLTLLGAICCKKKLEFMMMPQDVCDFLKIDYKTFERHYPKSRPNARSGRAEKFIRWSRW